MSKILLVFDDYAELMAIETALKKVGFDAVGLTSEIGLSEQLVTFNPDVVVGCGHSSKVSSLGVGRKLKEAGRWTGKSVLVFKPQLKPQPEDLIRIRADLFLETPLVPRMFVQVLGRLLNLEEEVILKKLERLSHYESQVKLNAIQNAGKGGAADREDDTVFVSGGKVADQDSSELKGGLFSFLNKPNEENYQDLDRETSGNGLGEESVKSIFEVKLEDLNLDSNLDSTVESKVASTMDPSNESHNKLPEKEVHREIQQATENLNAKSEIEVAEIVNASVDGTGVQKAQPVEIQNSASSKLKDIEPEVIVHSGELRDQLKKAQEQALQRELIYQSFIANTKVPNKSQVGRKAAKSAQKNLQKEWNAEELRSQDELRREFVGAMFKK